MRRLHRLALLLALVGLSPEIDAWAQDAAELDRFVSSDYTYCDAKLLAGYWGQTVSEAKARIGRKIGWNDEDVIEEMLGDARLQRVDAGSVACAYHETGYTYEDAVALAGYWGVSTVESKARVEQKILWGGEDILKDELKQARKASAASAASGASDPMRLFFEAGYTYCDAKLFASYWGDSASEAKTRIGEKLGRGEKNVAEDMLDTARDQLIAADAVACAYHETGYSYDDAVALSMYWGISTIESKARLEQKVLWRNHDIVKDVVEAARRQFPQ